VWFLPHTCFLTYFYYDTKDKENKCNKIFLIIKLYSIIKV
jgi:hypothetical protein